MVTFIFRHFFLCSSIEIQAYDNEPISECLKILNMISLEIRSKTGIFLPKDKKKFQRIFVMKIWRRMTHIRIYSCKMTVTIFSTIFVVIFYGFYAGTRKTWLKIYDVIIASVMWPSRDGVKTLSKCSKSTAPDASLSLVTAWTIKREPTWLVDVKKSKRVTAIGSKCQILEHNILYTSFRINCSHPFNPTNDIRYEYIVCTLQSFVISTLWYTPVWPRPLCR